MARKQHVVPGGAARRERKAEAEARTGKRNSLIEAERLGIAQRNALKSSQGVRAYKISQGLPV